MDESNVVGLPRPGGIVEEALAVLLGPKAGGLSPTTIRRLVEVWQDEHKRWQGRDLSLKRYVYVWADGVYFSPRLEHDRRCILVLMGADESGSEIGPWLRGSRVSQSNELLAIDDGFREGEQSWHELLVRLRDENGLSIEPELATGAKVPWGARLVPGRRSGRFGRAKAKERLPSSSAVGCTRRPMF